MFYLIVICIGYIFIVGGISYTFIYWIKRHLNWKTLLFQFLLLFSYVSALWVFVYGLSIYSEDYFKAVNQVDADYTPLANDHFISLFVFYCLSIFGMFKIWKKGRKYPPLWTIIYVSFIVVGTVLSGLIIAQLSYRQDDIGYVDPSSAYFMIWAPFIHLLISVLLIIQLIREEANLSIERSFKNKTLNFLNQKLIESKTISIWLIVVLLPIYLTVILVLILFGQDYNSLTKVFTDTTTWVFSEKTHPPYLDYHGHYLCTVAVCGDPKLVKPVRLGLRHGNEIVVNRQLLIANAFEDVITQKSPRFHKVIRKNYDKFGYPISKLINTKAKSNFIYVVMKPLEWLFLISLYLSTEQPEKLINEQYKI